MTSIQVHLLEKSKEAFIMSIEIFNKPTLKYRVEGFSFFICNAWELMLKAKLIRDNGEESIYYKDNPERTISLSECVEKVFTNKKDPLRINLEKVIELRNISTHFVTTHYEYIYVPLFQSCVKNFSSKIMDFFEINTNDEIPYRYLNLASDWNYSIENIDLESYDEATKNRLKKIEIDIDNLTESIDSPSFALRIIHEYHITKKPGHDTTLISIAKDADDNVRIMKDLKDPKNTHPYTTTQCVQLVQGKLKNDNIVLKQINLEKQFSKNDFDLFVKFYDLKNQMKYCYCYKYSQNLIYQYSYATIDLIVNEIKRNPDNIIQHLKQNIKK